MQNAINKRHHKYQTQLIESLQILSRFLTRDFIRFCASLLLCLCLSGTQLLANEEEEEGLRKHISEDIINFSKNSDWEGVWGEISQCDPLISTNYYICAKQSDLSIYGCDTNKQTCQLSLSKSILRNFNAYEKDRILTCDFFDMPISKEMWLSALSIEILISDNTAKPSEKSIQGICAELKDDKEAQQCRKAFDFHLTKSDKGITFVSNQMLDSLTCKTSNDRKGTLSGFYPRLNASFNCQKEGLSKVEKGICNSFPTIKADLEMNTIYNFLIDFAWQEDEKNKLKVEQLQWLKELNLEANEKQNTANLAEYISFEMYRRTLHLKKMLNNAQPPFTRPPKRVHMRFVSQSGAVKIYDKPSLDSEVLHTAILNDKATINLLSKRTYNGFRKIVYLDFWKDGKSEKLVTGYVQSANLKWDSTD